MRLSREILGGIIMASFEDQYKRIRKIEFQNLDKAIEYLYDSFYVSNEKTGEYTDLKNIEDIVDHLDREKLDFLIFRGDIFNRNEKYCK